MFAKIWQDCKLYNNTTSATLPLFQVVDHHHPTLKMFSITKKQTTFRSIEWQQEHSTVHPLFVLAPHYFSIYKKRSLLLKLNIGRIQQVTSGIKSPRRCIKGRPPMALEHIVPVKKGVLLNCC